MFTYGEVRPVDLMLFTETILRVNGVTMVKGGEFYRSIPINMNDFVGAPFLNRIPVVGNAFGSRTQSKGRTELVVFLTPRVIYDTTYIQDASDEIKSRLKRLQGMMRKDENQ